jgi:hypothetical protein
MGKRLSELPKVARVAIVGAIGFGILCCLLIAFTSLTNTTSLPPAITAMLNHYPASLQTPLVVQA